MERGGGEGEGKGGGDRRGGEGLQGGKGRKEGEGGKGPPQKFQAPPPPKKSWLRP